MIILQGFLTMDIQIFYNENLIGSSPVRLRRYQNILTAVEKFFMFITDRRGRRSLQGMMKNLKLNLMG